mgnify:CR=1 FL=1
MKKLIQTIYALFFTWSATISQIIPEDSLYLGQTPPGNTPQIFNLAVSSGSFTAERIAITPDGTEIYYSVVKKYYPTSGDTIKCYRYENNQWNGPFNLFNNYLSPGLSKTGDTLFFENNIVPYQTMLSYKNGTGWSTPQRILNNLNSAHYLQTVHSGNYYISSNVSTGLGASDWCQLFLNNTDSSAISLGKPVSNSADNLDFFIARDESYIILAKGDLEISFKKTDGGWTNPKKLSNEINFGAGMWAPYVSNDNKYLFYSTGTLEDYSDVNVYWVKIDNLVDSLKHTNFVPYLNNLIPNQTDTIYQEFNFTIHESKIGRASCRGRV